MTIEDAIYQVYGVRIHSTPPDLSFRKFKIDDLRNGFVMKAEGVGVFGSIIDSECFVFDSEGIHFHKQEHKDRKEIRFEWLIWGAARATFERGERLNAKDRERLALAVRRLEEWL